jgi:hypothetical protein
MFMGREEDFGRLVLRLNSGLLEDGVNFRGTLCEVNLDRVRDGGVVGGAQEMLSASFFIQAIKDSTGSTTCYNISATDIKFRKLVTSVLHPPELGTYARNAQISFLTIAREGSREVRLYDSDNMFSS